VKKYRNMMKRIGEKMKNDEQERKKTRTNDENE
jgi:hypothetical protein